MLKKSLGLSFAIIFITAMFVLNGCENPESPVVNVDGPVVTLPEQEGVIVEIPNPNIPAPTYPVDLKPFIEGGVGWISTTVSGDADVSGYTVEVSYQDPAAAALGNTAVNKWNRSVRLIAVYHDGQLLTLAELDPVSVFEDRKLAVRLLHVSGSNAGSDFVQYYGTLPFDGGPWTPSAAGFYENAPVVYIDYTISENTLTFNDGWLNPLLENITLVKKALVSGLDGQVYVNGANTYNFESRTNLMGIISAVTDQSNNSGNWWVVNDKIYRNNALLSGVSISSGGLSVNGTPWTRVTRGGGGFTNRIWALTANEYLSFSAAQVKSSANLGGAAASTLGLTSRDWYGTDGLDRIYVRAPGGSQVILAEPRFNRAAGTFVNTGASSYVLSEIIPLSVNTDSGETLAGIWANASAADYFYYDDTYNAEYSGAGAFTGAIYEGARTSGTGTLSAPLYAVFDGAPTYGGTYTYTAASKSLAISGGTLAASGLTGLGKLERGTTALAGGVRQWGYETSAAPYRFLFAEAGGGSVVSYGDPVIDAATQNLPWYYQSNNLYVINSTGAVALLGARNAGDTITGIAPGGGILTSAIIPIVKTSAAHPAAGTWTNVLGTYYFYTENRDGHSKKGLTVFNPGGNQGSGELYQGAAADSKLYAVDKEDGTAVLLGTYRISTGFGFNSTGLYFSDGGILGNDTNYQSPNPLGKLSVSAITGEYALADASAEAYTVFDSGTVSVDTGGTLAALVSGPVFSDTSSLPTAGTGLIYVINDNAGGAIRRVGEFTTTAGAVTQIASLVNTDALYIASGNRTVAPISATVLFNTILGDYKWALSTGNYVYKDAGTIWFNGFAPDVLLPDGSTPGSASVAISELRERNTSDTGGILFAVNANKIARYVGTYTFTQGSPEVSSSNTAEVQDALAFTGTGSTLLANTGVRKLHGEGDPNLNKTWASALAAADYITLGSDSFKYERGATLTAPSAKVFEVSGFWVAATLANNTRSAYDLYGLNAAAHTIAYLGRGQIAPASGTSVAVLTTSGGSLGAKTLLNINAIPAGHDLAGSWTPFTVGAGLVTGTTSAADGIVIGSTITVGSEDNSSAYIISGAGGLTGAGYAALTAANTYGVFVYDSVKNNGLVYVGSLVYNPSVSAGGGTYKTITLGVQTQVLKPGAFGISQ
jgi:hypothetical protein